MYCPQCGTESGSGLQFCRSCGANLKVIGKALTLSEAIARSDRGPLPKIKEMVKNLKVEHVTEEVSRALERMNKEIVRTSHAGMMQPGKPWWSRKKTAEERRENHIVKGTVSLFSGIGLTVFLYYFTAVLVLKLPPDWISKVPFEIEPVVRILWLLGLVPMLSGAGHILAGLSINPSRGSQAGSPLGVVDAGAKFDAGAQINTSQPSVPPEQPALGVPPVSITEHTTNLLDPLPSSREER